MRPLHRCTGWLVFLWAVAAARIGTAQFARGDANGDGKLGDVSDAIHILGVNFLGAGPSPCWATLDVDGDGETGGITDAVYLLSFSFLGGPPAAPLPAVRPGRGSRRRRAGLRGRSARVPLSRRRASIRSPRTRGEKKIENAVVIRLERQVTGWD